MSLRWKMFAISAVFFMLAVTAASCTPSSAVAETLGSGTEDDPYDGYVDTSLRAYESIWVYVGTEVRFSISDNASGNYSEWGLTTTSLSKTSTTMEGTLIKTGYLQINVTVYKGDMAWDGYGTYVYVVNKAFNVSFSSNGTIVHTETVEPNGICPTYTPDPIDGYTFNGWFTDEDLTTEYDFSSEVTANITLYAKWTENPVIISFYVEGSLHSTLAVPKGSVGVVYTPIMVEGVFAGWFYDEALTEKYDATRALDSDINLYAYGVPPLVFTSEPNASAVISQVSYGTFFFDATGSDGRYQIEWDFGDGNKSTDAIAYNTYSAPGLYTVTLKITNIYGETSVATYDVLFKDPETGGGEMTSVTSSWPCFASSEVVWSSDVSSEFSENTCPGAGQCVVSGLGKPFTSPTEVY